MTEKYGEFGDIQFPMEQNSMNIEVIKQLMNKDKDLNFKTELYDKEIKILTKLFMLGKIFDMDKLTSLTQEFKELRVSRARLGRLELAKALSVERDIQERDAHRMRGLFGGMR